MSDTLLERAKPSKQTVRQLELLERAFILFKKVGCTHFFHILCRIEFHDDDLFSNKNLKINNRVGLFQVQNYILDDYISLSLAIYIYIGLT